MTHNLLCYIFIVIMSSVVFSMNVPSSSTKKTYPATKVFIAGAGTSVGYFVFKKLLARKSQFYPIGLVRDKKGMEALKNLPGVDIEQQIKMGDILHKESIESAMAGCKKVVICTSSKPQKKLVRRVNDFFKGIFRRNIEPPKGSEMYYENGQEPYNVDYIGQKNVIDVALQEKVEHVVLLGNIKNIKPSVS